MSWSTFLGGGVRTQARTTMTSRMTKGAISGGGGHGDEGLLAVGRLVLSLARILHRSRNSIEVHAQRIFFRSKIFRPV